MGPVRFGHEPDRIDLDESPRKLGSFGICYVFVNFVTNLSKYSPFHLHNLNMNGYYEAFIVFVIIILFFKCSTTIILFYYILLFIKARRLMFTHGVRGCYRGHPYHKQHPPQRTPLSQAAFTALILKRVHENCSPSFWSFELLSAINGVLDV